MSISCSFSKDYPHLVFLPSGIGKLTPFLQIAVLMASRNCKITFINIQSKSIDPDFSKFFSKHPEIERRDFDIQPSNTSDSTISDPFIVLLRKINSSLCRLIPTLSCLSVSAIFSDFSIAATLTQISDDLKIPLYIISTTSAQFFSAVAYLPVLMSEEPNVFSKTSGDIEIPGLAPVSKRSIPPTWLHDSPSNYILTAYVLPNAQSLSKVKGVLLNTFDWFEADTIAALNSGRVLNSLPPVFPIGPLQSYESQKSEFFPWLDKQPAESVLFVNFERPETMSTDQIRELGKGLEICGYQFLWVHKQDNIDLSEFQSDSTSEETKKKGKVIQGWVNQETILAHSAIGGCVNECSWDSVMNAAWHGVPMLAFPHHGDQKMNAETVEKAGLGIYAKEWSWGGEKLVEGNEIGRKLKQMMEDLNIKKSAKTARERAKQAWEFGGSSKKGLMEIFEMLTTKEK